MGRDTFDAARSQGRLKSREFYTGGGGVILIARFLTGGACIRFHAMFRKRDSSALCSLTTGFLYDLKYTKGTEAKHRA